MSHSGNAMALSTLSWIVVVTEGSFCLAQLWTYTCILWCFGQILWICHECWWMQATHLHASTQPRSPAPRRPFFLQTANSCNWQPSCVQLLYALCFLKRPPGDTACSGWGDVFLSVLLQAHEQARPWRTLLRLAISIPSLFPFFYGWWLPSLLWLCLGKMPCKLAVNGCMLHLMWWYL